MPFPCRSTLKQAASLAAYLIFQWTGPAISHCFLIESRIVLRAKSRVERAPRHFTRRFLKRSENTILSTIPLPFITSPTLPKQQHSLQTRLYLSRNCHTKSRVHPDCIGFIPRSLQPPFFYLKTSSPRVSLQYLSAHNSLKMFVRKRGMFTSNLLHRLLCTGNSGC